MKTESVAPYVKRHSNGTYYVRKYLGTNPVTGKKVEAYKTLAATTFDAAVREASEYLANLGRNPLVPVGFEMFIRSKERMRSPVNTVETYKTCANYLKDYFAHIRVRDLTTRHVNEAYMELLDHGDRDGEPLSSGTVRTVNAFLSSAYKWFMGQGLADSNPTDNAMLPPRDIQEARPLDEQSVMILLDMIFPALQNPSTEPADAMARNVAFAAWLALYLGVRVGEACGLMRSDVHVVQGYVHVHGTAVVDHGKARYQPKTKGKKSRNISVERDDLDAIRAHEAWQAALFEGRPDSPILSVDGALMNPKQVSAAFGRMARAAGLPTWCHYHTLRHTHATFSLQNGGDVNSVQERLGHANASTTLNTYGHVLPGRDQEISRQFHDTMRLLGGSP